MASGSRRVIVSAMRILLFGGTRFLGRAIAEAALARGHELVLFHRGLSNPSLFPQAVHVIGDRNADIRLVKAHTVDAVIDTSAFEVFTVRASARAVGPVPYVFVSSVSVYADLTNMREDAPLKTAADAETAQLTLESYGGLKAECERALREELGEGVLCVRAGKIDGPHDLDERFRYWLTRLARGGVVLAPGDPSALVQHVDVRDLAEWIVLALESRVRGAVNATGLPMPMRTFLETLARAVASAARLEWVPDAILEADGVMPYSEMPYWLPARLGAQPVPTDRAVAAGLRCRPLEQTARDTWQWMQRSWDEEAPIRALRRLVLPAGISPERESKLLASASPQRF